MYEPGQPEPFDYSDLDAQSREIVLQKTDETQGLMRRTAENILTIGRNLQMVQQHLPEMRYSAWLRAEFAMSRQTAYNYMRVAARFSESCKTVLQLPARVLYSLASASDAIIDQVETGQIPPTTEALRAAKEAERQARQEAQARQEMIERLNCDLEAARRQVAQLQEQMGGEASAHPERERIRLNWYRITGEFQRSLRSILSQWPSPLDVLAFEADDWSRLSHTKELASRFVAECARLTQATKRIVDGSKEVEAGEGGSKDG